MSDDFKPGDRIQFPGGQLTFTIKSVSPAFWHATTEDGGNHLLDRQFGYTRADDKPNEG